MTTNYYTFQRNCSATLFLTLLGKGPLHLSKETGLVIKSMTNSMNMNQDTNVWNFINYLWALQIFCRTLINEKNNVLAPVMIIPTFEPMINPAPCKHAYYNNEADALTGFQVHQCKRLSVYHNRIFCLLLDH